MSAYPDVAQRLHIPTVVEVASAAFEAAELYAVRLGFFDDESGRVECAPNPSDPKVLPMCPV